MLPLRKRLNLFERKKIRVMDPLVFYSEEGESACLGAVCAWEMGGRAVRVYEGGWSEYSQREQPNIQQVVDEQYDISRIDRLFKKRHAEMRAEGREEEVRGELVHIEREKYLRRIEDKMERESEERTRKRREQFSLTSDYDSDL